MRRMRAIRRTISLGAVLLIIAFAIFDNSDFYKADAPSPVTAADNQSQDSALETLEQLAVKGRSPKTGYTRDQFGGGWQTEVGCDTRNQILARDLRNTVINSQCQVVSGVLDDPYTGKVIQFERGALSSQAVQIDHVVALSDAWQKGAQQLSFQERVQLANDPLELLAVDGSANQQKSDGDAATWLPSNKPFRCQYVARQIAVKKKYGLWVTTAEKDAMIRVLNNCSGQLLPAGL